MDAAWVKANGRTGDVLLVHGNDLEQEGIQVATCSPFCHAAQLLRVDGGGLLVAEMLEPNGYRSISFDDWLVERAGQKVFFGQAPDQVRNGAQAIANRQAIYAAAQERRYDFAALPLVWLSQITGKTYPVGGEVCSLLVGDDWEATGYPVPGDPAPGSFLELCVWVALLTA